MSSKPNRTAEEWTNIGGMLNGEEQYEDALVAFNRAIAVDSKYAEAYYGRGSTYFFLNKYQLAIPDLSQAIDLSTAMQTIHLEGRELRVAAFDFSTAMRTIHLESRELRLLCYLGLKDYQRALSDSNYLFQFIIKDYKRSREKPNIPLYYYLHRGKAYVGLKKYEEAIADFDNAVDLLTDTHPRCNYGHAIFYHRGNCYFKLQRYRQAIADYDKALEELAYNRPDDAPSVGLDDDVDENVLRDEREEATRRLI